jgi:hypothetical protein
MIHRYALIIKISFGRGRGFHLIFSVFLRG